MADVLARADRGAAFLDARRPTPPAVDLKRASDIRCMPIRWLWNGWLAQGKLHILAGAPGTGKTTIALALAATVSTGGRWPDGSRAAPANVLIWSGEDDAADTLVPRLKAAGADLRRVFIVGDTRSSNDTRPFDPAADLGALEFEASRIGDISLLIADPVVSAVTGDSHKNTEVRRALQPLVNLGARLNCAVLGITHFSKGTAGREPTERVTGSVAFGALARIVMVTGKRQEDGDGPARIFARSKSNIGPDDGGFGYELRQVNIGDGIEASAATWGAMVNGTAREILGEMEAVSESPRDDAADWLTDLLSAGPMPVKAIKAEANGAGVSWRTIENAKRDLGIEAKRQSEGNTGGGFWTWQLPRKTAAARPHASPQDCAVLSERSPDAGFGAADGRKTARPQDAQNSGVAAHAELSDGTEVIEL